LKMISFRSGRAMDLLLMRCRPEYTLFLEVQCERHVTSRKFIVSVLPLRPPSSLHTCGNDVAVLFHELWYITQTTLILKFCMMIRFRKTWKFPFFDYNANSSALIALFLSSMIVIMDGWMDGWTDGQIGHTVVRFAEAKGIARNFKTYFCKDVWMPLFLISTVWSCQVSW